MTEKTTGNIAVIMSRPPRGFTKITNIYWDPETEEIVVQRDPQ